MASKFQSRFLLLFFITSLPLGSCDTDHEDASALRSLMDQWQNLPPSWKSGDPCDTPWEGIQCENSRVTSLKLSTMGLEGSLSGDLAQLSELRFLDLSYNGKLKGSVFPNIANMKKLTTLILAGCSFSGTLPSELGNLPQLSYLALNSNKFSGRIPASLGNLSNLYWFDLADNQFTGTLPTSPGLNQLLHTKHFHFNKNQLSGSIPDDLFSRDMTLLHLLLDGNNFSGRIPASLGLVQSLEVLRLDRNSLTGPVPSNISNLLRVSRLC